MKLLVTGGAGFIGSNFVRHVMGKRDDVEVVVLDKLTYAGNPDNLAEVADDPRYSFVKGDICDDAVVRECMRGCDVVLNFAAETHVDRSIGDPGSFVQTDVYGAYVLLEAAKDLDVARFVQISTDEVYGERMESPATEESALMPRNPYAASKAGGDRLAFSYWATYGVPVVITRCSNNYGPESVPREADPALRHERHRRRAAAGLRHRQEHPRLDPRARPRRRAGPSSCTRTTQCTARSTTSAPRTR